eukprot:6341462-Amphidinium_carterae.2
MANCVRIHNGTRFRVSLTKAFLDEMSLHGCREQTIRSGKSKGCCNGILNYCVRNSPIILNMRNALGNGNLESCLGLLGITTVTVTAMLF